MTGTNLNKLRIEPIESTEGQYTSAHNNLTEVRVRYDEMKKQRVIFERKIENLKVLSLLCRRKLESITFSSLISRIKK